MPKSKWRRRGTADGAPVPNDLLIMLEASAIRLRWSAHEERRRRAFTVCRWRAPTLPFKALHFAER